MLRANRALVRIVLRSFAALSFYFGLFEEIKAQSAPDSTALYQRWQDSNASDTARLNALGKMIEGFYIYANADRTDSLIEVYLSKSLHFGAFEQYADALELKGIQAYIRSDLKSCRTYMRRSLAMNQRIGNTKGLGSGWNNLAVIYTESGDLPQALTAYRNSQRYSAKAVDFYGFTAARSNLCDVYSSLGFPQTAESILRLIVETDPRKIEKGTLASAHTRLGNLMLNQNRPSEALTHYLSALRLAEEVRDVSQQASLRGNIATVHLEMKQFDLAEDSGEEALRLYGELGDSIGIFNTLVGQAATLAMDRDTLGSLSNLERALSIPFSKNDPLNLARAMISYVRLLTALNRLDTAEIALESVRRTIVESSSKELRARAAIAESILKRMRGRLVEALELSQRGRTWAREANSVSLEMDGYLQEYRTLKALGREREALDMYEDYVRSYTDLLQEDKRLEVFGNAVKYDFEKQAIADSLSLVSLEERRMLERTHQRQRQTGLLVLLALMGGFALVFWFQRNQINRERRRSDALLENILPADVAEELKNKGSVEARKFDGVAVLFTDFSGFTAWSAHRSASEVVEEINRCFATFDSLADRFELEKIKTIGDAYMAASGLKSNRSDAKEHLTNALRASFAMLRWIDERRAELELRGESYFGMRVGIHFGPAVAGVAGTKKFQYDLWGDTVNTASRMESCGAIGRLNVSEAVRAVFLNEDDFRFEERESVEVKGKGPMKMYWVDEAPPSV